MITERIVGSTLRQLGFSMLAMALSLTSLAKPASAGTKIVHSWIRPGQPLPKFHKMLIAAIVENYLVRQEFEDEMERRLATCGVVGIKSHMVLPPRNELNDERELTDFIKSGGYDGVLVIHPLSTRTESEEQVSSFGGPAYRVPPGYGHLWPYWHTTWAEAKATTSRTVERTIISAAFNLYTTSDEELIWSGETETVYTKDFKKVGREYAKAITTQLIKDKLIPKK
jgi:hypothetical protein